MTFCLFELIVLQRARPFPAPLRLWPTCAAGGVWRPLCGSRAAGWAWSRTPTGSRPRAPSRCSPPAQLHRERGGEWLRWWDHSAAANVLSNKELSQKMNTKKTRVPCSDLEEHGSHPQMRSLFCKNMFSLQMSKKTKKSSLPNTFRMWIFECFGWLLKEPTTKF